MSQGKVNLLGLLIILFIMLLIAIVPLLLTDISTDGNVSYAITYYDKNISNNVRIIYVYGAVNNCGSCLITNTTSYMQLFNMVGLRADSSIANYNLYMPINELIEVIMVPYADNNGLLKWPLNVNSNLIEFASEYDIDIDTILLISQFRKTNGNITSAEQLLLIIGQSQYDKIIYKLHFY